MLYLQTNLRIFACTSSHPTQPRRIVEKRREKGKKEISNGWHTSFNGVISFEIIIGHKNYENARKVPNLV